MDVIKTTLLIQNTFLFLFSGVSSISLNQSYAYANTAACYETHFEFQIKLDIW